MSAESHRLDRPNGSAKAYVFYANLTHMHLPHYFLNGEIILWAVIMRDMMISPIKRRESLKINGTTCCNFRSDVLANCLDEIPLSELSHVVLYA